MTSPTSVSSPDAMDRPIARRPWGRWAALATMVLLVGGFAVHLMTRTTGSAVRINEDGLTISQVEVGVFEDFIPLRGRVTPERTVFLDAVEGGRVEEILVEDGADVTADQLLVRLSNPQLQLDVIARETAVAEQLNNLRSQELELSRTQLNYRQQLVDIEYNITRLTRLVERYTSLESASIPEAQIQDAQDELAYNQRRRAVLIESQDVDIQLQQTQMVQLQNSTSQLESNLDIARRNLDALNVRAPVAGRLTALNAEIGQSLAAGERLGQVDSPNAFKIVADIDEFYLDRVAAGQTARMEVDGQTYTLRLGRVDPQVDGGLFTVELFFTGQPPANLRRGQTIQTRLTLGDNQDGLILPLGPFHNETGGRWVFVVSPDGAEAVRRTVVMGRRNTRFVEVIEGLEPGEAVITSSYGRYEGFDRVVLQ